ncbi:DEAD/DEAH box helicase [Alcaligenes endophyticus]|uniref:DEAD/DEAH box helicase n=1 Tax=Alcaligenes endophyticus TaxID=1929088 RepID=A0ABT8EF79_9BURK|nr:DEAD/DEAH box helicase [Alcaligenes endophyticus]MCX5590422.1 DEAD/DEAH box helicase [Alcaligenes endophyticus]MDN4119914.1 DEAD/DEAH box helicase [Alcaligenes endophyticus]
MDSHLTFASLGLAEPLLRAITDAGYQHPTPIQAQAIPKVMQGGDLLAAAQTGTGKTAGFTLPILHRLLNEAPQNRKPGRPRALILAPTRELAAQVEESVRLYAKHTRLRSIVMYGGVNINPQFNALRKPVDILVATPGRLLDHVRQRTVDLSGVEILVLDEADRMLDMGFIRDIRKILSLMPVERQTLLFSATFSDEIRDLARGSLRAPEEIAVAARNTTNELITQQVVLTEQSHKRDLLSYIIRESGWNQVLVFCRTKHGANRLADKLARDGLTAEALHGNKSQAARTRALAGFKSGKVVVLVATDIAARGLDIDQLPYVVNFELPNVPEDYVHRIGRTGRAGSEGVALSLVDRSEMRLLKQIERLTRNNVERIAIDGWTPPSAEALSAQAAADREAHRLAEAAAPKQRSARPMRGHKDNRGGQADTRPRRPAATTAAAADTRPRRPAKARPQAGSAKGPQANNGGGARRSGGNDGRKSRPNSAIGN